MCLDYFLGWGNLSNKLRYQDSLHEISSHEENSPARVFFPKWTLRSFSQSLLFLLLQNSHQTRLMISPSCPVANLGKPGIASIYGWTGTWKTLVTQVPMKHGFSVDLYEDIWVGEFSKFGSSTSCRGSSSFRVPLLLDFSSHENRVSPWASLNITNKKVEHTHAHHYLEFQNGWCLAFIMKLVEQTQPKSMKSVQFHPSPPTWKQTPKNTKNNHPKHSRPKKHDEKKTASTPHQTKIPFILTQLNILQIYCGIRDTFSPRLRLNAKLLYATW